MMGIDVESAKYRSAVVSTPLNSFGKEHGLGLLLVVEVPDKNQSCKNTSKALTFTMVLPLEAGCAIV